MKKIFILSISIFFSIFIYGQSRYVTVDPDGYTNIREKPNAKSKIIGKVTKHQVFYHPKVSCGFEETEVGKNIELENSSWMPIFISEEQGLQIGYIFRKNIRLVDKFTQLGFTKSDKYNAIFSDRNIRIKITSEPFDKNKYKLAHRENVVYINGEIVSPWDYSTCFQLKRIEVEFNSVKTKFPKKEIEGVFFLSNPISNFYQTAQGMECDIKVYKRENGIYYLSISGGDGAESFDVMWTIDNGQCINKDMWSICNPPDLIMIDKLPSQF